MSVFAYSREKTRTIVVGCDRLLAFCVVYGSIVQYTIFMAIIHNCIRPFYVVDTSAIP